MGQLGEAIALYRFAPKEIRDFPAEDFYAALKDGDSSKALQFFIKTLLLKEKDNWIVVGMNPVVGGTTLLYHGAASLDSIFRDPAIIQRYLVSETTTFRGREVLEFDLNPQLGRMLVTATLNSTEILERFIVYCPSEPDPNKPLRDLGTLNRFLLSSASLAANLLKSSGIGKIAEHLRPYKHSVLNLPASRSDEDRTILLADQDPESLGLAIQSEIDSAQCEVAVLLLGDRAQIKVSGPQGACSVGFFRGDFEPFSYLDYHLISKIFKELLSPERARRNDAIENISNLLEVGPYYSQTLNFDQGGETNGNMSRLQAFISPELRQLVAYYPEFIYDRARGDERLFILLPEDNSLYLLDSLLQGRVPYYFERRGEYGPAPANQFTELQFSRYPDGSFDVYLANDIGGYVWSPRCKASPSNLGDSDALIAEIFDRFRNQQDHDWRSLAQYVLLLGNSLSEDQDDDERGKPHHDYLPDITAPESDLLLIEMGMIATSLSDPERNRKFSARFNRTSSGIYRCCLSFQENPTHLISQPAVVLILTPQAISAISIYAGDKLNVDSVLLDDEFTESSDFCCTLVQDSDFEPISFDDNRMPDLINALKEFFEQQVKPEDFRITKGSRPSNNIRDKLGKLLSYFPFLMLINREADA
jgi:hypothetical protein